MDTIKLFENELQLADNDSFILIKPTSYRFKLGNRYVLEKPTTINTYLGRRLLKYKKDFILSDIPEHFIWLSKNCEKSKFLEIQQNIFKSKLTDSFSILIFSNVETEEYIEHQQQLQIQKYKIV